MKCKYCKKKIRKGYDEGKVVMLSIVTKVFPPISKTGAFSKITYSDSWEPHHCILK